MTGAFEVNFDGLIGPTHNHSGLALGNLASLSHKYQTSSPRQAALQGLQKMKLVHSLGIKQGLIPPQERPCIDALKDFGYKGSIADILKTASRDDLHTFFSCCSASSMWCANAATVTPSQDTKDGKVHMTTANLVTHPHRAVEARQTEQFLRAIFSGEAFVLHPPLVVEGLLDEGAANHMRLSVGHKGKAVNIFVYGKPSPLQSFPSRQSLDASMQIAKDHQIDSELIFVQQDPETIERGVFHNDVIAASNEHILLVHERAFFDPGETLEKICSAFKRATQQELTLIKVEEDQLSVEEAVRSYMFNSQIVTTPDGKMEIIAPIESHEGEARAILNGIMKADDNPVSTVHFVDLKQSMANGGGPACLRLRVLLTPDELAQVNPGYLLDDKKFELIEQWINAYYRDTLNMDELSDPQIFEESRIALNELTNILGLGNIYSFQA